MNVMHTSWVRINLLCFYPLQWPHVFIVPKGAQTVMQDDIDSIKMFHLLQRGQLSQWLYSSFSQFWNGRIHIESLFKLSRRMVHLSAVDPKSYDCCINSCCPLIGDPDISHCPHCKEPWLDEHKQWQNAFKYIPLTNCIKDMYSNPSVSQKMSYWQSFTYSLNNFKDVFSGSHYQGLPLEQVNVDNVTCSHKYFSDPRDIGYHLASSQMASKYSAECMVGPPLVGW